MNKNVIAIAFGVALSAIACSASAQAPAPMPKNAAECKATINTEMQNYPKAIAAGVAKGSLTPAEVAALNKAHDSLLVSEKAALADTTLTGPECFDVINKIRAEVAAVNAAVASPAFSLPVPPKCPAPGQPSAAQCDLYVRAIAACGPGAKSAAEFAACMGSFQTSKQLNCALAPAAEKTACDKANNGRVAAAPTPAPAPAPAPAAAMPRNATECKATINAEMLNYPKAIAAGVAKGTLTPAEVAALNKAHDSLLVSEKAALADTTLTGPECFDVINKIRAEVAAVNAAVASPAFTAPTAPKCPAAGQPGAAQCDLYTHAIAACAPNAKTAAEFAACAGSYQTSRPLNCALAPAAEKAACDKANTARSAAPAGAPMPAPAPAPMPKSAAECKATINAEMLNYPKAIAAGVAKGSLTPAEVAALNKAHDSLLVSEKTALADTTLTGPECFDVINKIRAEVAAVNAAIASPAFAMPPTPKCPAAGQPSAAQCDLYARALAACGTSSKSAPEFAACMGSFQTSKPLNCALAPAAEKASCDKANAGRAAPPAGAPMPAPAPAPAPAPMPKNAAECKATINAEMLNYPKAIAAGVAKGTLTPAEVAALNKAHEALLVSEKIALADTTLTGPECFDVINKIRAEVAAVTAAVASPAFVLPQAPKCPAAGQPSAAQCDLFVRGLASCGPTVKTAAEYTACIGSFQSTKPLNCSLASAAEKVLCDRMNVGRAGAPAAAPVPAQPSAPMPKNAAECKASINLEMLNYPKAIAAGVAKGSLTPAEVAALNKAHDSLLVSEKAALADTNLTGQECYEVINKIRAEVAAVNAAIASPAFAMPPAPKCPAAGQPGAAQCDLTVRALAACGPSSKSAAEFAACMGSFQTSKTFNCAIAPAADKASCEKANTNRKP